ncbi:glycoside hydrolase family 5 protein [Paenibacillus methanolicus]|uniref:Endoglucanase n=1 Tax=Paenibacillus methanolicus TaxID=582686 RepID=A0A5S5CBF3_9BACL|nr:glycoside hydrolase family 5 protein [Paenibacillus methanolicus]TYP76657.1 endoglucanase [Paenibacillus methanolicus]
MNARTSVLVLLLLPLLLASCTSSTSPLAEDAVPDPYEQAKRLGKGVNLGNALEAPKEGEWGMTLQEAYFELIADGGFDTVRVPIKWSAHATAEPPYTIDEAFAKRVDWVLDQAESHGLNAVIDMHHYDEIFEAPDEHKERFLRIWEQLAQRYKDRPLSVYFEPLNEPHGNLDASAWNDLLAEAIRAIRGIDERHTLVIGTSEWGGIRGLPALRVPEEEKNAIVTFHYYEPFLFTHQGAEWNGAETSTTGLTWPGPPASEVQAGEAADQVPWVHRWFEDYNTQPPEYNPASREQVIRDLDQAAAWGEERNRPLWLGEFGAYSKADMASRVRWTEFIRTESEKRSISWAYWEFGAGFGVYNRERAQWNADLHEALIGGEIE